MSFDSLHLVLLALSAIAAAVLILFWFKRSELTARVTALESELQRRQAELADYSTLQSDFAELKGRAGATERAQRDEIMLLREKSLQLDALKSDYSGLQAESTEREKSYLEQLRLLKEAEAGLKQNFENLANRIFEEKSTAFKSQSKEHLDALLSPLTNEIKEFRQAHVETSKEIFSLKQLNELITTETGQLTRALRGDNKTQGDWGELVLERILESSGLNKGINYETQLSFNDENLKRNRPDLVLFLPEDKAIVIDSKVSLVAYERWINSEDGDIRKQAMKEHLLSLRRHIDGLAARNYDELPGKRNLDFVLLFVPIEAAFIDAVREDPSLYNYALDKNVALAAPSTLYATCKTVAHLQKLDNRSKNAEKIAIAAGLLHDRFVLLYEELSKVGESIQKAGQMHQKAFDRIKTGRGNLLGKVDELREMGAKTKKNLPASDSGNLLEEDE
jgi:DNA recombination protein RmuC